MRRWIAQGLLLTGLAAVQSAAAETMRGVVIVVVDGDTVLFKPDHDQAPHAFIKVRLADIDAPERDQPYGDAAAQTLAALVLHQPVEVDRVATDVYGRTVGRIRRREFDASAEMVREGLAWVSARRRDAALRDAQRAARKAQRGLWQDDAPVQPWVWRRAHARPTE